MKKDIPPKIYKQINKIQANARENHLLVLETFSLLEELRKSSEKDISSVEWEKWETISREFKISWHEFKSKIKQLEHLVEYWSIEEDEQGEGLLFVQKDPLERFLEELEENFEEDRSLYYGLL